MGLVNLKELVGNCDWKSFVGDTLVTDYEVDVYYRVAKVDKNIPSFEHEGKFYQVKVVNYEAKKIQLKASDKATVSMINTVKADNQNHVAIFLNYKNSQDDFFILPIFPKSIRPKIAKCFEQNAKDSSVELEKKEGGSAFGNAENGFGFGFGFGEGDKKDWLLIAVSIASTLGAFKTKNKTHKKVFATTSIVSTLLLIKK